MFMLGILEQEIIFLIYGPKNHPDFVIGIEPQVSFWNLSAFHSMQKWFTGICSCTSQTLESLRLGLLLTDFTKSLQFLDLRPVTSVKIMFATPDINSPSGDKNLNRLLEVNIVNG
ncbi:hypothetical protein NQ317_005666 [Molorchus minor]|uniref:Uncharacterized protein n=1 Tax=Molorchus minor TaxID=1323400 RepID=A0ABQ9K835_9CUCU|nr:hypothetical protein NQ317_005666 [Molorchus minor]